MPTHPRTVGLHRLSQHDFLPISTSPKHCKSAPRLYLGVRRNSQTTSQTLGQNAELGRII